MIEREIWCAASRRKDGVVHTLDDRLQLLLSLLSLSTKLHELKLHLAELKLLFSSKYR